MKILFIITGLATGGAEIMLLKLLSNIDRSRYEPYVISLTSGGEIANKIRNLSIPVYELSMQYNLKCIIKFFSLIKTIKKLKPDLIHTWMYHADLIGGIAGKISGVNNIFWCIRNSDLDKNRTKLTTHFAVKSCGFFSKWIPTLIISCSEKAKMLHALYGYKESIISVIPNGFDISNFVPNPFKKCIVKKNLGIDPKSSVVGLIARFDPQKNHKDFIAAAALVSKSLPEVSFLLAGRYVDNSNKSLLSFVDTLGMSSRIYMIGLREDMPDIMSSLDILVCSSSYGEGFPNVLGEAMACGVPCITTDVGDSAYIVANTGWVVPINNIKILAETIINALSLSSTNLNTLGQQARNRVIENFEIKKIARKYEEAYESHIN